MKSTLLLVLALGAAALARAERSAIADRDTATDGKVQEAEFEALKAVVRVLETRASIGQSLLRAYGRAGG